MSHSFDAICEDHEALLGAASPEQGCDGPRSPHGSTYVQCPGEDCPGGCPDWCTLEGVHWHDEHLAVRTTRRE